MGEADLTGHTRGTIRVEPAGGARCHGPTLWADGMLLAQMAGEGRFDHANARLYAAAPALLAACRAAFEELARRGDPFAGGDWELGHRLSAAIGLATDPDYPTRGA